MKAAHPMAWRNGSYNAERAEAREALPDDVLARRWEITKAWRTFYAASAPGGPEAWKQAGLSDHWYDPGLRMCLPGVHRHLEEQHMRRTLVYRQPVDPAQLMLFA